MEILAPTNSQREVAPLHRAGATELYCGLRRPAPGRTNRGAFPLNDRDMAAANVGSVAELRRLTERAHGLGVRVYVTFNALYVEDQLPAILEEIDAALDCGVDALIVADFALLEAVRRDHPDVDIILSTLAGAFNARTCAVYAALGATRITLPRHLSLRDIRATAAACDSAAFEVFVMSERCYFPNALCSFTHAHDAYGQEGGVTHLARATAETLLGKQAARLHSPNNSRTVSSLQDRIVARQGSMCCRLYVADRVDEDHRTVEAGLSFRFVDTWRHHRDACGLCALRELVRVPGVRSLKLVGRQHPTAKICADVRLVRRAVELAEADLPRAEYLRRVRALRGDVYPGACGPAYCYYAPAAAEVDA